MIELREYTKAEMAEILGTNDRQGMRRKLSRYGIIFTCHGRGDDLTFNILEIQKPFKVYAITELGMGPRTDFKKLAYFCFYFLNDEMFAAMPDQVKEVWMERSGHRISRQTIQRYTYKLKEKGLFEYSKSHFFYYFAYYGRQNFASYDDYCAAWAGFRNMLSQGYDSGRAIWTMIDTFGGIARKQAVIEMDERYKDEIAYLNQLASSVVESDVALQF